MLIRKTIQMFINENPENPEIGDLWFQRNLTAWDIYRCVSYKRGERSWVTERLNASSEDVTLLYGIGYGIGGAL